MFAISFINSVSKCVLRVYTDSRWKLYFLNSMSFRHEKVLNFGRSTVAWNGSSQAVVNQMRSCFNMMFYVFNVCA